MKISIKKCLLRVGIAITGLCVLITALSDMIPLWVIRFLYQINIAGDEASSIGIIGGADGPTQIFYGSGNAISTKPLWMILFLMCMGFLIILYKRVSKNG